MLLATASLMQKTSLMQQFRPNHMGTKTYLLSERLLRKSLFSQMLLE